MKGSGKSSSMTGFRNIPGAREAGDALTAPDAPGPGLPPLPDGAALVAAGLTVGPGPPSPDPQPARLASATTSATTSAPRVGGCATSLRRRVIRGGDPCRQLSPGSALDAGRGDALDDEPLGDDIEDQDGKGSDDGAGHEEP